MVGVCFPLIHDTLEEQCRSSTGRVIPAAGLLASEKDRTQKGRVVCEEKHQGGDETLKGAIKEKGGTEEFVQSGEEERNRQSERDMYGDKRQMTEEE